MKNEKVKAARSLPKMMLMGVVIAVLAVGGGILGSAITSGKAAEIWTAREEKPEKRIIVPYSEFLINLTPSPGKGDNYLRIELSFSVADEESEKLLEVQEAKIRDGIITILRGKSKETIYAEAEGNLVLKDELKNKVNQILDEPAVKEVYITNIVMQ